MRQLNCYGFTKYKDDLNSCSDASSTEDDGKLWTFHHPDFQRDQPQLLSKIQRKTTSTTQAANKPEFNQLHSPAIGLDTSTNDCERKELEHEIEVLQDQLNNMEFILQDLSKKMASVHLCNEDSMLVKRTKRPTLFHNQSSCPTKNKVLVHDKELFDSKTLANKVPTKVQAEYPLSVAKLLHSASFDLPDLGKIGTNDSDLLDGVTIPRCSQGSGLEDDREKSPVKPMDISTSISENIYLLDEIDTSLGPLSYMMLHPDEDRKSRNHSEAQTDEPDIHESNLLRTSSFPILIQDDGDDDKSSCEISECCSETDSSVPLDNNLLDSEHLKHLEKALRSLPINERLAFVRDVLKEIPDISSQGVSVSAISDKDLLQPPFKRNLFDLNYDSHVQLSQMENLLERVGLKIHIRGKDQPISSTSCSRKLKSTKEIKKSSKDSSFVRIEA